MFLDNAPIHKTQIMLEFYTIHNLQVLFNAPYSPEWNAIELVFNVIKTMLKKHFSTSEPMKRIVYEILYYKLYRRICNNIVDHTFQRWFSIEP